MKAVAKALKSVLISSEVSFESVLAFMTYIYNFGCLGRSAKGGNGGESESPPFPISTSEHGENTMAMEPQTEIDIRKMSVRQIQMLNENQNLDKFWRRVMEILEKNN